MCLFQGSLKKGGLLSLCICDTVFRPTCQFLKFSSCTKCMLSHFNDLFDIKTKLSLAKASLNLLGIKTKLSLANAYLSQEVHCKPILRLFMYATPEVDFSTGTGTIIAAYPLSPSPLLHNFSCGQLTKLPLIINKLIISKFVLCNESLQSAHKDVFYGKITCLATMGRWR